MGPPYTFFTFPFKKCEIGFKSRLQPHAILLSYRDSPIVGFFYAQTFCKHMDKDKYVCLVTLQYKL